MNNTTIYFLVLITWVAGYVGGGALAIYNMKPLYVFEGQCIQAGGTLEEPTICTKDNQIILRYKDK